MARALGATDESHSRPVFVAFVVVGQTEQLERLHSAVVTLEVVELLALAAEFVSVDADPAMAGVEQRRAGLGGAGQFSLRDLLVADDHRPVDEGFVTELLPAVVGRRRSRFTVDARPAYARGVAGPITSIPRRSSSAGATSMKSSATSNSSSTAVGFVFERTRGRPARG